MRPSISKMVEITKNTEVIDWGVDAYSIILRSQHGRDAGYEFLKRMENKLRERGFKPAKYNNHGYQGWAYGELSYGEKGGQLLLNVLGKEAAFALDALEAYAPSVTRVDFQITVKLPRMYPELAAEVYEEARKAHSQNPRLRSPSLVRSATGDTLYVGKRGGESMLRLYEKSVFYSGLFGQIWRYEVEFRGDKAERQAATLGLARDRWEYLSRTVFSEYYRDAIRLPLEYRDTPPAISIPASTRSNDQYISWARLTLSHLMTRLTSFDDGVQLLEELGIQPRLFDLDREEQEGQEKEEEA